MSDELFDAEAAGAYLGGTRPIARTTLANWRVKGIGPAHVKLENRMVRYRRSDLDAWLARGASRASTSQAGAAPAGEQ